MKTYLIRGVPPSVQRDGWWLNADRTAPRSQAPQDSRARGAPAQVVLLVALIVLGDVLVWQVMPGISLAVFCAALVLGAVALKPGGVGRRLGARVAGGTFLALMPLVELVQPLSMLIAVVGLSVVLVMIAGIRRRALGHAALRLWPVGIAQGLRDLFGPLRCWSQQGIDLQLSGLVRGWLVPLGLGGLFVLLLLVANPVAVTWLEHLTLFEPALPEAGRVVFWLLLVPVIWSVLSVTRMREQLRGGMSKVARVQGPAREGLINPASTARALVVFNTVFAVQTLMDMVYLYGGVGLPAGITYAEYAHRGAYPLVITALLAGAFALMCQRWVAGAPVLRALLMLWVAQNVALVISSEVRLSLYVEVYGLTRLRLAAAIWMGLVATGLVMILWQVCAGYGNRWLLVRLGALGAGVLYVCAWVSFDAAIAAYNLSHDVRHDTRYLCQLADGAQPVIAAYDAQRETTLCRWPAAVDMPQDWREWGFRNWRARHSLNAIQTGTFQ
ncbi:DUF4153 domain-containing protein [Sulfitobacter sp. JB4-11]|uniref:DUF4153 domain-containing protein n=1 Tax=Sulfitobacter rhodophyticola TaxID=3238304 RepID=UPI003D81836D